MPLPPTTKLRHRHRGGGFRATTVYALCANNGLIALQITQAVVNAFARHRHAARGPECQRRSGRDLHRQRLRRARSGLPVALQLAPTSRAQPPPATPAPTVQPADAGNYSVLVTNVAGPPPASNAALTVNVPPAITTQPQDQNVTRAASATSPSPPPARLPRLPMAVQRHQPRGRYRQRLHPHEPRPLTPAIIRCLSPTSPAANQFECGPHCQCSPGRSPDRAANTVDLRAFPSCSRQLAPSLAPSSARPLR